MLKNFQLRHAVMACLAFALLSLAGTAAEGHENEKHKKATKKLWSEYKSEYKNKAKGRVVIRDPAPLCDSEATLPPGPIKVPIHNYRNRGKVSDRIPDIVLRTHNNKPVRFFTDLVKDKTIVINFMFTECVTGCIFNTSNLYQVYKHLGDRVGREIMMVSITLDPKVDSPEVLKRYVEKFGGERKGWLFLTGDCEEINQLRLTLGFYDPDPVIDAQRDSHSGLLTFGNDITNRWIGVPIETESKGLAWTIRFITRGRKRFSN